jgi:hypothetical protein
MATPLDPKQLVSFEELLMSQVVQQEALIRLFVEKGRPMTNKIRSKTYDRTRGNKENRRKT